MTDENAAQSDGSPSLGRLALGDMSNEHRITRRVLERVPDSALDWSPHEKSWTTGKLCTHMVDLVRLAKLTCELDELDMEKAGPGPTVPDTTAELLARFDEHQPAAMEAVKALSDEELMTPWTLRNGEHVIFTAPRLGALRTFTISHLIHHRAQLGLYLRLLDESVPAIYGGSADESA